MSKVCVQKNKLYLEDYCFISNYKYITLYPGLTPRSCAYARIQKGLSDGGPTLTVFLSFFFIFFIFSWWGQRGSKYQYKWAIFGPPAKHHLNGVSLMGRCWPNIECWLGRFVVLQGMWTSIVKKPYIFVIFHQRGPSLWPPLDPHMCACHCVKRNTFSPWRMMSGDTYACKLNETQCDFQQCGILTSVESDEPLLPPVKLRNSKWRSVSSLKTYNPVQ